MTRSFRVGLLASRLLAQAGPATPTAGPATLVAAHRGGAGLWPENSLLAFRQALALGVDALEFDLHMTADGEIVVLHDPTLDRTSTGTGPVRDLKLADLAGVRLKTRDGAVTSASRPSPGCSTWPPRRRSSSCPRSRSTRIGSATTRSRTRCWRSCAHADCWRGRRSRRSRSRRFAACASWSRRPGRCSWWRAATSSATARARPRRCAGRASSAPRTSA
ncbi:MAG: hypothetical protein DMD87_19245 [Candidatus Rokuibacteriota bacterium]|nr:MAG: hypothetical protein DMD87_19245 [Candidatus Rokubacteria bacterium]